MTGRWRRSSHPSTRWRPRQLELFPRAGGRVVELGLGRRPARHPADVERLELEDEEDRAPDVEPPRGYSRTEVLLGAPQGPERAERDVETWAVCAVCRRPATRRQTCERCQAEELLCDECSLGPCPRALAADTEAAAAELGAELAGERTPDEELEDVECRLDAIADDGVSRLCPFCGEPASEEAPLHCPAHLV